MLCGVNGKQMDETLFQFFSNNVIIYFCVLYARETLNLLQCISLSHCHNIKEMTAQKES